MAHARCTGQVVAITGGARGIGREIARSFADAGAKVVIGDVDVTAAEHTAAELGGGTVAFGLDVTDAGGFAKFLDETESAVGPLDVLVNNAGIMPIGPFLDESDALTARTIDIDLRGVLLGTKLAGRRFHDRGRGHVVNIASLMGTTASPNAATYCAAKYAAVGLGQALRQEWRGSGVHITTICPGYVRTELIAGMPSNLLSDKVLTVNPHDVAAAVVTAVASGKSGQVFVPQRAGLASKGLAALPGGLRDALFRWSGGTAMTQLNVAERAAYQSRMESDS